MIDVVMLSVTKDIGSFRMTQNCIKSLHLSESNYEFNINLIESNPNYEKEIKRKYKNANVYMLNEKFNYNKALNIGLKYCKTDKIIICNNDLVFSEGWFDRSLKTINKLNLDSASPLCPKHEKHKGLERPYVLGNEVGTHFCGWCVIFNKSVLDKILPLDEKFIFWCQDNDMVNTLKKEKPDYKHALITNTQVYHLNGQSHRYINKGDFYNMTEGCCKIHDTKWKK